MSKNLEKPIVVSSELLLFILLFLGCSFAMIIFATAIKLGSFYNGVARILLQF